MRKPGGWMHAIDERILEFLSEHGNHQPKQIALGITERSEDLEPTPAYIGNRCRELTAHQLLTNRGNGVYSVTEVGDQYLAGSIDAADY